MHKWVILSAILFATLSGVLFGGSYASAASIYDDVVSTTNELPLYDVNNISETKNFAMNWASEFLEVSYDACQARGGDYCDKYNTINDVLTVNENGNWAVIYIPNPATGGGSMDLILSTSENAYAEFQTNPPQAPELRLVNGTFHRITNILYSPSQAGTEYASSGGITRGTGSTLSSFPELGIAQDGDTSKIFLSTFPVTYPAEYEGEIIPDTYTAPHNLSPDIEAMEIVNWRIRLIDTNYVSPDPIPFRCDNGIWPWIEYDLYNNDTDPITKLSSGIMDAGTIFEFKSEDYGVETEYKFIANYMCGDGINNFAQQTTYYFTISAEGTNAPSIPIETCYKETFPYFDMAGCMSVVGGLISNLSFGTINLPLWTIDKDSCHTLGTIGDWLNLEGTNRTICPQFSTQVRNIVTPFLTFVLGLTIMGALMNKSQRDSH